jgi:alanine racemase
MIGAPRALIDLQALRHNLDCIQKMAPQTKIMAVVKANAYGHGLVRVARALQGVDALAVARLGEALNLRQHGVDTPVVVLEGIFNLEQLAQAQQQSIAVVIHDPNQLELLRQADPRLNLYVWIKIDSGMHRLGVAVDEVSALWRALCEIEAIRQPIGFMTHLSHADLPEHPATALQLQRFELACAGLPGPRCIANSAAVLAHRQTHAQWLRPGIMLYGVSPFSDRWGHEFNLKPVMRLVSELIAIKPLRQGEGVGYSAIWRAPRDTHLGVVAVGYGDGYPRHARNGTPVLVGERRVHLVGRVSMDLITVDLGPSPQETVGTPVVLWGDPRLPVEEVAAHADMIAYELLCIISGRVTIEEQKFP